MKAKKLIMLKCSTFYLQDLQPGIGVLLKLFFLFLYFLFFFCFFFKNNGTWIVFKAYRYVWRRAELVIPHWSPWLLAGEADCYKKVNNFINRTWMVEEELKSSLPQTISNSKLMTVRGTEKFTQTGLVDKQCHVKWGTEKELARNWIVHYDKKRHGSWVKPILSRFRAEERNPFWLHASSILFET